ncbi:hypothetical protein FE784_19910 [Paenibacillus hemerocallicola]|uniref:Uncharacterized protein n=1 Tax=Paenibacillus hemerocallicola TaxID=1172614 RepID=A0A5C4T6T8_9BACL|nr:hypothetical protein [Paenibacillus hemerocallicola]TNJ64545.1 hypothetical protein FE784_19910 [Paenibacillus hemerocallicola]
MAREYEPLPIDREYIYKLATLHEKIAALSYKDSEAALAFLRAWADGTKKVTPLWEEVTKALVEDNASEGAVHE